MITRKLPQMAAAIVLPAAAAMTALILPALSQDLPNGNGRDMVQMICSGCHDLSPITDSVGFSRQDWETVVKSMIDMGADIKPEQVSVIANYLAANFPPKSKQ